MYRRGKGLQVLVIVLLIIMISSVAVRIRPEIKGRRGRTDSYSPAVQSTANDTPKYCPFRTPTVLPTFASSIAPGKSCRVLFDEDEDTVLNPMDLNQLRGSQAQHTNGIQMFAKLLQKDKKPFNGKFQALNSKQNLDPAQEQPFSFGLRMRTKYPDTPQFKKFLQSPMSHFSKLFGSRTQDLRSQVKRRATIVPISPSCSPLTYIQQGYRLFVCIAQFCKKQAAISQCRAFYNTSLHLQPYDEAVWEWVIKFEEDLGQYSLACDLCRTAVMFLRSETFVLKYLKLADKCERPIAQVRSIIKDAGLKLQLSLKVFLLLIRMECKSGNATTGYQGAVYLIRHYEGNSGVVLQICRVLEACGHIDRAISILFECIDKGCKVYAVYSLYVKLIQLALMASSDHLQYLLNKAQESIPQEIYWKFILDVAAVYYRSHNQQAYCYLLKKALVAAPNNSKVKPYLAILKLMGRQLGDSKNQGLVIESNKQGLLDGRMQLSAFSQWKHYLHYSLFYLFYGMTEAKQHLEGAAVRWPYAGRLWAEILWVMRVDAQPDAIRKWRSIIEEVPKSGQVWCQGGRIYVELCDYQSAMFCFQTAMHLTPQYGDSFVEAMGLLIWGGKYKELKALKNKIMHCQPFYGNVWCFLKEHPKSSAIDVYRKAKSNIRRQLYSNSGVAKRHLTALEQYNNVFLDPTGADRRSKERIISAYDQLENNRC